MAQSGQGFLGKAFRRVVEFEREAVLAWFRAKVDRQVNEGQRNLALCTRKAFIRLLILYFVLAVIVFGFVLVHVCLFTLVYWHYPEGVVWLIGLLGLFYFFVPLIILCALSSEGKFLKYFKCKSCPEPK